MVRLYEAGVFVSRILSQVYEERFEKDPVPGAVIAIQIFGDVLGFNPHCHILVMDGCLYAKGMFRVAPELKKLLVPFRVEAIFRNKVFRMLVARRKISREMIAMLSTWWHSGFHVFCGNRIQPKEDKAMESLARYIIYPPNFDTLKAENHIQLIDLQRE